MKWGEYVLGPSLLVYANAMYDYQTKKKEKKLGQYIGPRAKMTFLFSFFVLFLQVHHP